MKTRTAWIGLGLFFAALGVVIALSATGKAPFLESPHVRIARGQGKPSDFVQICDLAVEDMANRGGVWTKAQQASRPEVTKTGKPQAVKCTARLLDGTQSSFEIDALCGEGRGCYVIL